MSPLLSVHKFTQLLSSFSGSWKFKSSQYYSRTGETWKLLNITPFSLTGRMDPACSLLLRVYCFHEFGANMFLPVAKKQHIHLPQSPIPACLLPQQHLPLLTACSLMSYRITGSEGLCSSSLQGEKKKKQEHIFFPHKTFTLYPMDYNRHMHTHTQMER